MRIYPYLSPILKTKEDAKNLSPLYLDMVTDARILCDKDEFFKGILEKLKTRLNSLNAKKINEIEKFVFISRKLRRERETSMYRDEELRLTPEELYHEYDAKVSLDAIFVYEKCDELLSERHV